MAYHNNLLKYLRPEQRLLLETSRRVITSAGDDRIRAILADPIDWPSLLTQAEHHRVIPLVSYTLRSAYHEHLPPEVLQQLRARSIEIAGRNFSVARELLHLLTELERRGIPALTLKGPMLAQQAYDDLSLRRFDDLDIMIRQCDVAGAIAALASLGYIADQPLDSPWQLKVYPRRYHDYKLRKHSLNLMVELQWKVIQFPFTFPPDVESWWADLKPVTFCGKEVASLDLTSMLLVLCVHGSKHLWERLNWICDIGELIRGNPDLDWERLLVQARCRGAARMLLLGLMLANSLLDAPLPPAVHQHIEADRQLEPLVSEVLQVLFPEEGQPYDSASGKPLFYLRMLDRSRDRLQVCIRHSHSLLNPLRMMRTYGMQPVKRLLGMT